MGEENGCEPLNQFRIMNIEEDEIDETETTESTKTTENTKSTGPAETTDPAESTDDLNESSALPPTEDLVIFQVLLLLMKPLLIHLMNSLLLN